MTEKSKHQPKGYNEASDRDEEESDDYTKKMIYCMLQRRLILLPENQQLSNC